jgi:hypothetical protein
VCFIFNLTQSAFSFPEPNISTDKILCWGAGGGEWEFTAPSQWGGEWNLSK